MGALTNTLTLNIVINCVIGFALPYFLNKVIFVKLTELDIFFPPFVIIAIIYFIVFLFMSMYTTSKAVQNTCTKKTPKTKLMAVGTKVGMYAVLMYLLLFYVDYIKTPFTDIGGNNLVFNSIAEGYYITLLTLVFTISNYFEVPKLVCKLSAEEKTTNWNKIVAQLNES
jgi:hypothetical protein